MKRLADWRRYNKITRIVLMLLFGTIPCLAEITSGTIITIAGNGNHGFSGDCGPATSATLNDVIGLAVDPLGNLYVADNVNQRIRKVSPAGIITTVAGNGVADSLGDGGRATNASLNNPHDVAVDAAGNLYIAEYHGHRIRKVNTAGIISTFAGNGTPGFSGDDGPATRASLNSPPGVAVDMAGNLYIADEGNQRIRKVTPAGIISTVAGNGVAGFFGDNGPALSAMLNFPSDVAVDTLGRLYIADAFNNRIRKVDTDPVRTITTVAGNGSSGFSGDNVLATNASLNNPYQVALDQAGNFFIADWFNLRIRKVTAETITTVAGNGDQGFSGDGGPATSARLGAPIGVAVDTADNIYIADNLNSRVRMVVAAWPPLVSTLWIGLKNTDDQGTQFDLRTELRKNDVLIASGECRCIAGVTRNPDLAKETRVTFGVIADQTVNPGDTFSFKVMTRIGTTPEETKCAGPGGSHSSALGLRLYYDSADRPSSFRAMDPAFLHSTNSNLYFDGTAPCGGTPRFKDSPSVNFSGDNPWKEVGTWVSPPPN